MTDGLSLSWDPLIPWPLLAGAAVLAALLVGLALYRRAPGAPWRGLALALVLLILAGPRLVDEDRLALSDIALVIVDDSPSQDIGGRDTQRQAAVRHLTEQLARLPSTEVELVRAGGDALDPDAQGTQLFGALESALSRVPKDRIGAVFLVTDGQVHDVPAVPETLGLAAPVHTLLTGVPGETDRRIEVVRAPSFGLVGRDLTLSVRVEDLGVRTPAPATRLTIIKNGEPQRDALIPIGQLVEVPIALDSRGQHIFELAVEPLAGEVSTVNNRTAVQINGVRDRLRVLLVSGEAHAGERTWRNILKSDPSVDLVHFTILRPPEKQDGTPIRELSLIAFPTRELFEIKLGEFDLVIFDRYRRRGVLPPVYLENVAHYVRQGGALMEAVGPNFATPLSLYRTPLGRVLPAAPSGGVYERGFRPRLTETGERHPVTAGLPGASGRNDEPTWGRWFRQIDAEVTQGEVLMDGLDQRPLLVLDRVGEGRVAQVLSDQIWLWSRGFEGGGPQAELVRRVAHWLMKEPDLEEEDLRARVSGRTLVVERRSLESGLPEIEVESPSGERFVLALTPLGGGRAEARLEIDEVGLYRASDGDRLALAAAGSLSPLEFSDLRSTPERLDPLAAATGGGIVRISEEELPGLRKVAAGRDTHGSGWLGLAEQRRYLVEGISEQPLIPPIVALVLVLGLILFAWRREAE